MNDTSINIKLTGDRDVAAAFKDLREYLPNNALPRGLRKGAQLLATFVALAAPKLTGRLSRNIGVRAHTTDQTQRARVTVNTIGKTGDERNAFYWRFLEEGFHTRKGEFLKFPFVVNVFDSKRDAAAQAVIDECDKAIQRAEASVKRAGF